MLVKFDPKSGTLLDATQFNVNADGGALPALTFEQLHPVALRHCFRQNVVWEAEPILQTRLPQLPANLPGRVAAVLIPLVWRASGMQVLFTERAGHLPEHAGQISFPGGRCDGADATAQDTAVRETYEEIGIDADCIEILGSLPLYQTATGYVVHPVTALVHPPFTLQANPDEVARVFEVPLEYLMNPANHQLREIQLPSGGVVRDKPNTRQYFVMPWSAPTAAHGLDDAHAETVFIWGATAAMLRNLCRYLAAASL